MRHPRRPRSWMQWTRRVSQAVFLLLFIGLAISVRLGDASSPGKGPRFFFDLDPLTALATALASRSMEVIAWPAVVLVVATVFLGRFFCGWICPLGTVHTLATALRPRKPRAADNRRTPWHRVKYFVLVALLVMAVFGVHWTGIFDPIPLMFRSLTTFVLPGAQYGIEDSATAVYQADPHIGPARATWITEPVYRFFRNYVFQVDRQALDGGVFIAFWFILIVGLNFWKPRFWCRYICPLGGLLGLLARKPLLRLRTKEGTCTGCGLCAMACPAAAQPDQPGQWLPSECYGCWNCVASCSRGGITFSFAKAENGKRPTVGEVDFSRRAALGSAVAGAIAVTGFRQSPQAQEVVYNPWLIRPPGALPEREFLQRCIQCGLCMRVCPTNALHPCALEAGLEGLWTPRLIPKVGYCEYNCTLCGQVCPTGAIQPLTVEAKHQVKLGLAMFNKNRCLPYAYDRNCIICEEHCPVPDKAIYFVEEEITRRDGSKIVLKRPHVDPDKCVGCGICEWSCVFRDEAAVRVTSANESRNNANQPILPGESGDSPY
ncbi:MAG: 4Fe-4S binding protein [Candidatus Hydrogenedentes bacterium]|nr:4Fe-4S binding protein [Candidatus Hydrogenedentota bacterium]